jgi:large subunit ribosomal protein L6
MVTVKKEIETGPLGVSVELAGDVLTFTGPSGKVSRKFSSPFVTVAVEGGKILLEARSENRKAKAVFQTFQAHIANLAAGAKHGFEYKMEVVQSHFPIKVTSTGSEFKVENFIGEKAARIVHVEPGVTVKIDGKNVILSGVDLEVVSRTAQKIEDATKVKKKDHRTFQDGIYIVEKKVTPKGGA